MPNERLVETKQRRDFDGRYRVDDFFCPTIRADGAEAPGAGERRGAHGPERVSAGQFGCVFEIKELLNVVSLDRVVFVVDDTTDFGFLQDILAQGWEALPVDSPNRSLAEPRVLLFRLTGERSVPALLSLVAEGIRGKA